MTWFTLRRAQIEDFRIINDCAGLPTLESFSCHRDAGADFALIEAYDANERVVVLDVAPPACLPALIAYCVENGDES